MNLKSYFNLKNSVFLSFTISLVFCLPRFILYFSSEGLNPLVFVDWDEPFYLTFSIFIGQYSISEIINSYSDGLLRFDQGIVSIPLPHLVSDYFFGSLANFVGFNTSELGLFLDLICLWSSLFILYHLNLLFVESKLKAYTSSLLILTLPKLLSTFEKLSSPFFNLFNIDGIYFGHYPGLPIFRGINTQVSIPFFLLAIYFCSKGLKENRSKYFILSGSISGLCLYLYFYSWASATACCFFLIVFNSYKKKIKSLVLFSISFLILSLPGILSVYFLGSHNNLEISSDIYKFTYFSKEYFIIAIILILFLLKNKLKENRPLMIFILSAIFSEIILINFQYLTPFLLCAYHFPIFYFKPLIGGLIVLLFLDSIRKPFENRLLISFFMVVTSVSYYQIYLNNKSDLVKEFLETSNYFKDNIPENERYYIVNSPNPLGEKEHEGFMIFPLWIRAINGNLSIDDVWSYYFDENLNRELLTSLVYTGELKTLGNCPNKLAEPSPMIFNSSHIFLNHRRHLLCENVKNNEVNVSEICKLYKETNSNLIFWEKRYENKIKRPKNASLIFKSSKGSYELYRLKNSNEVFNFCKDSNY